jgi:hypothetical protein
VRCLPNVCLKHKEVGRAKVTREMTKDQRKAIQQLMKAYTTTHQSTINVARTIHVLQTQCRNFYVYKTVLF